MAANPEVQKTASAQETASTSKLAALSAKLPYEDKLRLVRIWSFIGGIVIFVAVLIGLGYLGPVIEFLCVGLVMGFLCSPIVNALERRHVARPLGAGIALVVVLGLIAGIFVALVPLCTEQLISMLQRVPAFLHEGEKFFQDLMSHFGTHETQEIERGIASFMTSFSAMGGKLATDLANLLSTGIIPGITGIANTFTMFFLGIVLGYWLAADYPTIVREFAIIAGPKHQDGVTLFLAVLSRSVGGYMRSSVITSIVAGVLAFIGFLIVGQPYAALMGILTAVLHIIPVVGPFISATLATLTALFVSIPCAFWTLIVTIVAANITDNVISPVVMRSAVQVHPALSLLAIVVGSTLGGALGMIIAIPISAAIKGVFIYYFETKTKRQIVSYNGALFQGTPFTHADGTPAPSFDALDDDHFYDTSELVPETDVQGITAEPNPTPTHTIKDVIIERAEQVKEKAEQKAEQKRAKDGQKHDHHHHHDHDHGHDHDHDGHAHADADEKNANEQAAAVPQAKAAAPKDESSSRHTQDQTTKTSSKDD